MNNPHLEEENIRLKEEISRIRKSLDWYKSTYEERSLASIAYDRISKKYLTFLNGSKIKIHKTHSQFSGKILCTVVNHNYSKNATTLLETFTNYFDSVILDSGSDSPPRNSLKLENVYYSGLLNKAYSIASDKGYKYLLFICSDVLVTPSEALKMFNQLANMDLSKLGLYSPASVGSSYNFCSKQNSGGLREVPFVEGYMFLCDLTLLNNICPIDTEKNLYGWGIDIVKSFYSKEKNKLCVIDDGIVVEHLAGTGYSREIAKTEMINWVKSLNNAAITGFFENTINSIKE